MYLSTGAVIDAIGKLRASVHPFIGITFLACKAGGIPVGTSKALSLDSLTRDHMDRHHSLDRGSSYYFQPFRGGRSQWVTERYPSTGLQTVNTQTFPAAFIHSRSESRWGLVENYVDVIKARLLELNLAPRADIRALSAWIYKGHSIGNIDNYSDLIQKFAEQFRIDKEELDSLFEWQSSIDREEEGHFVKEPAPMSAVLAAFEPPPDAAQEGGRAIASLRLTNTGPSKAMSVEFGERLSLFTGDNGLGKSFLLDVAWWAATGGWAASPIVPEGQDAKAAIEYQLRTESNRQLVFTATFDRTRYSWVRGTGSATVNALAVFSRADGSFAVSDPLRGRVRDLPSQSSFSREEVWNGRQGVIEGLIRDWSNWMAAEDKTAFDRLGSVLKRLSPDDLGVLTPGEAIRVPGDPRAIPTIRHQYGAVPVIYASSGVQRVLMLAYLVIWLWQEHELAAEQQNEKKLRRMIVLIDELEAHLHPKWQRIVLPALLAVGELLSVDLSMQVVSATHSPMILASVEAFFDSDQDVLYHLYGERGTVHLEEAPFVKYGDVAGWLTSPLFGLRHARSREAEKAIEDAKALQLSESPIAEVVAEVSSRLVLHLADDDKFWPRWISFAERFGVDI